MPERIQLSRKKGWRMPPNTVKVDRSTKWGNPYTVAGAKEAGYKGPDAVLAGLCVEMFKHWLSGRADYFMDGFRDRILADIGELRGKNLACWCKPGAPCHADVLLEIANAQAPVITGL